MRHVLSSLTVLLVCAFATAQAPPGCCPAGHAWRAPGCAHVLGQTYPCPDDYCPKSMPKTCSICKLGPDDYCPKSMPKTCSICKFGPDDYCAKPPPCIRAFCAPWYRCVAAPCCKTAPDSRAHRD